MNADAIIDQYEDLWRKAALANTPHFGAGIGRYIEGAESAPFAPMCALLVGPEPLQEQANDVLHHWSCPECHERHVSLSCAMIHLNNVHRWTWDRFANKFRDVWHEGLR